MNSEASGRPLVIDDVAALRAWIGACRGSGRSLGLVPTMGALHDGHLSLVRASRARCAATAVTIFVNPTQFGPHEDLTRYPRTWEADLESLAEARADLVFAPPVELMYPAGFSTYVEPPEVARPWEGVCRPTHFRGVATVVLKLFHLLPADVAFFGQKDFQQCLVVRRMVRDLNVPIEIQVCPIVREPDGLAMSSRNRYLSPAEREQALALSRGLRVARQLVEQGQREAAEILAQVRGELRTAGIERIDYAVLADPETLAEVERVAQSAVLLLAAYVGQTRLIDNCLLGEHGPLDEPRE